MELNLETLLSEVSVDDDSEFIVSTSNHDDPSEVEKTWNIGKIEDFWVGYCNLINNLQNEEDNEEYNPYGNVSVSEIVEKIIPLILEFDLSFPKKDDRVYYDELFLQKMARILQKTIMETCLLDDNQDELICCVMESNVWEDEYESIDHVKFRFQFPGCVLNTKDIKKYVKPILKSFLESLDPMKSLLVKPVNKGYKEILESIIPTKVFLYGSDEFFRRPKLTLTHIWRKGELDYLDNRIEQERVEINLIDEIVLDNVFNPMFHEHVYKFIRNSVFFDKDKFDSDTNFDEISDEHIDKKFWMPLFFSINYCHAEVEINRKDENNTSIPEKLFSIPKTPETNETKLQLCEIFIDMLDNSRFQHKIFWLDIVKALNTCSNSKKEGLSILINFTKKALNNFKKIPDFYKSSGSKSVEDTCKMYYSLYNKNNIDEKTLAYYACNDNPIRYSEWHRNWCLPSMERALSGLDADVGRAFYRLYWLKYICLDYQKQKWIEFDDIKWKLCNGGSPIIKELMYDGFIKFYEREKILILQKKAENTSDENFAAIASRVETSINKLIEKLKCIGRSNSFVRATSICFEDKEVASYLDKNPYLTPVCNGVIEIFEGDIIFRAAKPQDYCSLCTNVNYEHSFTWKNKLVCETFLWLHKVFPDTELLHHFLKLASTGLIGLNLEKMFSIWTGKGHNSKSMIIKLFESVFGPLCINFPVELLTGKDGNAGNATPHLARAKSTRFAFVTETDDDKPMNKGVIKKYTGGDSFYARLLHDNGEDTKATFKLIVVCNNPPIIINPDDAVEDRTVLIPFLSTWIRIASENIEDQFENLEFQRDNDFENRIPLLSSAFFWIICEYYRFYALEGLKNIPEIVKTTTQQYWQDNDHYAHYVNDCLEQVYLPGGEEIDQSVKSNIKDLYNSFCSWYKFSFPSSGAPPSLDKFKKAITKRLGEPKRGGVWRGIRIIDDDIRIDDDDENKDINDNDSVAKITREKLKGKFQGDKMLKNLNTLPKGTYNIKKHGLNVLNEKRKVSGFKLVNEDEDDEDYDNYIRRENI